MKIKDDIPAKQKENETAFAQYMYKIIVMTLTTRKETTSLSLIKLCTMYQMNAEAHTVVKRSTNSTTIISETESISLKPSNSL